MKTLFLISLAGAVALAAAGPLHAQTQSERGQQTREEPRRGNSLARFAARALGASEDEADAAALLLPAVQALTSGPQEQAGGINVASGDINNDGVVGLEDCQLALRNPHGVDPAAASAFIRFDGVNGESRRDVRECGQRLALLLPAVQKVREAAPSQAAPHVRVIDGASAPLAGEAEITLKRGAPQR